MLPSTKADIVRLALKKASAFICTANPPPLRSTPLLARTQTLRNNFLCGDTDEATGSAHSPTSPVSTARWRPDYTRLTGPRRATDVDREGVGGYRGDLRGGDGRGSNAVAMTRRWTLACEKIVARPIRLPVFHN